ncbi:hypothetical protein BT96DRAFT_597018 [Gymnopus androsaceus JB14]|uniref:Uncharacterized protein n=1 Tax=Gymnopus androsaceus JB14 TaxID=1447944 RepID=A0A6A4GID1_9AGAR|nr:hypothetical protein BT96DRAFT_597018 [Gymnopus androsaceus JB14]
MYHHTHIVFLAQMYQECIVVILCTTYIHRLSKMSPSYNNRDKIYRTSLMDGNYLVY